jgi:hypothetical protein
MSDKTELLKTANASGFPLQIALQGAVAAECPAWEVIHKEHSWANAADGNSGFIDFVVRHRDTHDCAVIECKRVLNSTWVFLAHNGLAKRTEAARAWVTKFDGDTLALSEWCEARVPPSTPVANFCTLRGQGANDKNTFLERVSSELVSSTEALAMEERPLRPIGERHVRFYFNVLVTTATLQFAEFKYEDLSREHGTLVDAEFIELPYLRFRKQFTMRPVYLNANDWRRTDDIDARRENTVFVVSAKHFTTFLNALDVTEIPVN